MIVKNKICTKCKTPKPLESFNKKKKAKDGHDFWCKACTSRASKKVRQENPKNMSRLRAKWKQENSNKEKLNNKGYNLTKYWTNLSPKEAIIAYDKLLIKQQSLCIICNRHSDEFKSRFHVDHCHSTGKIRGLLCFNCNVMLGNSLENIKTLINAIKYLTEAE
jgi:hypothetical protein